MVRRRKGAREIRLDLTAAEYGILLAALIEASIDDDDRRHRVDPVRRRLVTAWNEDR
jgi:hypothetical protein